jgi:hypothetical protein
MKPIMTLGKIDVAIAVYSTGQHYSWTHLA